MVLGPRMAEIFMSSGASKVEVGGMLGIIRSISTNDHAALHMRRPATAPISHPPASKMFSLALCHSVADIFWVCGTSTLARLGDAGHHTFNLNE